MPDPAPPQPDSPAQSPLLSTAEIFRQAMTQNAEIHQRALDDMQRRTDEMHEHLSALTHQRVQALQIPNFQLVHRASVLDADFWSDTVRRAIVVLQQHGEFPSETPAEPEPDDAAETP